MPLPYGLRFPFRRQNCVNISQFQTHKIDPAVTARQLVIDPHQKFTPQETARQNYLRAAYQYFELAWFLLRHSKRWQRSAFGARVNKRTSQGDCRLPETLLEAEGDAGADSCSNSGTKEKHSQPALDDGNPLTVQHESIRDCWRCVEGGSVWEPRTSSYYAKKQRGFWEFPA